MVTLRDEADIIKSLNIGKEGCCFLFGAGASRAAGYPLMAELTIKVLKNIKAEYMDLLKLITEEKYGTPYDDVQGTPNIEAITDALYEKKAELGTSEFGDKVEILLQLCRNGVVDVLKSINNIDLSYHVRFFSFIKQRYQGVSYPIWVLTTNYDMLIEYGAAIAGIPLYDGFEGAAALRRFDSSSFNLRYATSTTSSLATLRSCPHIKLVKLHGSLDWWHSSVQGTFSCSIERPSMNELSDIGRVMILPRRRKSLEVSISPYDELWRTVIRLIGSRQMQYMTTIGYSFNDEHLNQDILMQKTIEKKLIINAFMKTKSSPCNAFNGMPNFRCHTEETTELWDFAKFVNALS